MERTTTLRQARPTEMPPLQGGAIANLRKLSAYLWDFRGRVLISIACLILAKLATVAVPLVLKHIVDRLDSSGGVLITAPLFLLAAYGSLRLTSAAFNELRDALFARVRYRAMRRMGSRVLAHLHSLSLRFHLERRTGGVARDLERGAQSLSSILNYLVFSILPTVAELVLVAFLLLGKYPLRFALVTLATVVAYVAFTLGITAWRVHYRHLMNAMESEAHGQAVDGLLNYETVKYFGNEAFELERFENTMSRWEEAAVKTTGSMSLLNFVQAALIAIGVTIIMTFAAQGVAAGNLTIGDLVLVNALMLQLFLPLNTLGIVYRALNYALADMDRIIQLLGLTPDIQDAPDAEDLIVTKGEVEFREVAFAYQARNQTLASLSFMIPKGSKIAVVGPSGGGKSTLVRLLFRFYEPDSGSILIDGQDIRRHTQISVRAAIGIVPQDTVLFNESIFFNIAYADTKASLDEVRAAAGLADLDNFISSLPHGYDTVVGERGLKLSGGERQRVGIARAILKRPRILVFDEATSSLDSRSEQLILEALRKASRNVTTLAIAHRLSTIVDADQILVLDGGRIVERGRHESLLEEGGLYAQLWALQQEQHESLKPGLAKVLGCIESNRDA